MTSDGGPGSTLLRPPPGDRASALIEGSLDCIVTIDPDGVVIELNKMAEQVLGWSQEEALGRNLADLMIPAQYVEAHRQGLARYLAGVPSAVVGRRLEMPVLTRSGAMLRMEMMVVAVDNDGRLEFTAFMRDLTELRQVRAELAASQQRHDAILQHSTLALILDAPAAGQTLFLGGTSTLGHEPGSTLQGEGGFLSMVHPDDHEAAHELMEMLSLRRGSQAPQATVDLRLRHADGRWITGRVSGEDLAHVPNIGGYLLRVTDVTAQRAQRRQLLDLTAQLRTLVDNLASGALLEDGTGRVLVANQALVDLFGVPLAARELVGTRMADSAHLFELGFADPQAFAADVRQCFADGVPSMGVRYARTDGGVFERDYLPIVSEGHTVGHLWVYRDVTESMVQQQLLEEQNLALAELARMKNEFVARASHELRSPLTSVVSFTEILAAADTGPLNADQAQYVEVVLRNAHRLLRLIEDLLLMTKLESHTLQLSVEPLDLGDVVRQVVAELAPRAADASVTLVACDLPRSTVAGDGVRLHQVVSNVVGNALAYTPAGGRVDVAVVRSDDGAWWQVVVTDTGVGIEPHEVPQLFEPFFRAGSGRARSTSGSGLGLSIVQLIVELHGGRVEVSSTPGVGTEVTVLLPAARP